jgi:hypothetical protein
MLIYSHTQTASPHFAFPLVPAVLPCRDEARGQRLGSGRPSVTGGDRNVRSRPPHGSGHPSGLARPGSPGRGLQAASAPRTARSSSSTGKRAGRSPAPAARRQRRSLADGGDHRLPCERGGGSFGIHTISWDGSIPCPAYTDAELQSIASWLKDGLSAARIAIRLSALRGSPASRNAVISIVHRNADLRRRPRGNRQLVMPAPGNQMLACDPTALAADHRGGG